MVQNLQLRKEPRLHQQFKLARAVVILCARDIQCDKACRHVVAGSGSSREGG